MVNNALTVRTCMVNLVRSAFPTIVWRYLRADLSNKHANNKCRKIEEILNAFNAFEYVLMINEQNWFFLKRLKGKSWVSVLLSYRASNKALIYLVGVQLHCATWINSFKGVSEVCTSKNQLAYLTQTCLAAYQVKC